MTQKNIYFYIFLLIREQASAEYFIFYTCNLFYAIHYCWT